MAVVLPGVVIGTPSPLPDEQISQLEAAGHVTLTVEQKAELRQKVRDYILIEHQNRTAPRSNAVLEHMDRILAAAGVTLDLVKHNKPLDVVVRDQLLQTPSGTWGTRERLLDDVQSAMERLHILVMLSIRGLPAERGGRPPSAADALIRQVFAIFNEASGGQAKKPSYDGDRYRIVPFVEAFSVIAAAVGIPEATNSQQLARKIHNAFTRKRRG